MPRRRRGVKCSPVICKECEKPADSMQFCQAQLVILCRRSISASSFFVDDDTALSEMLTEYLAGEGIRTTAAFNGPDGAAAALSGQFRCGGAGRHAAGHGRQRSPAAHPPLQRNSRHHADRQGRRCRPGGGPGDGRRRLHRQALFPTRACGAPAPRSRGASATGAARRRPPRSGSRNCRRASAKSAGMARPSN